MATNVPKWLPDRYHWHWRHPWEDRAYKSFGFRRQLKKHGYLSPNFTVAEARSKDGARIPRHLARRARRHAFNLEKLRHALGGASLPVLSWYRSPAHNAAIGGASQSRHMSADATDFTRQTVDRIGRNRFVQAAERVFANGGVGQYPWGAIHVDSRGFRARWSDW